MSNEFKILQYALAGTEKDAKKAFEKHMKVPAKNYHDWIYDWLKEMKWPLRRGLISPKSRDSRLDPIRDNYPTDRLWPGDGPLYANQRMSFNRKPDGFSIDFYNEAEHANVFFEKVDEHPINSSPPKDLVYWAGHPLPWSPPMRQGKAMSVASAGFRKVDASENPINHPGHMQYELILHKAFDTDFKKAFDDAFIESGKSVFDKLRGFFGGNSN